MMYVQLFLILTSAITICKSLDMDAYMIYLWITREAPFLMDPEMWRCVIRLESGGDRMKIENGKYGVLGIPEQYCLPTTSPLRCEVACTDLTDINTSFKCAAYLMSQNSLAWRVWNNSCEECIKFLNRTYNYCSMSPITITSSSSTSTSASSSSTPASSTSSSASTASTSESSTSTSASSTSTSLSSPSSRTSKHEDCSSLSFKNKLCLFININC